MITFQGNNGLPDPTGQYVAALAISMVYANDPVDLARLATYLGGAVKSLVVDRDTVPPDYVVITGMGWALVAFAGTTNRPQVLNYVNGYPVSTAATGIPSATNVDVSVNAGFQSGLDPIQPAILTALGSLSGVTVFVTGHSYGAASGFILARRLKALASPPAAVQLLTFGEPRSFTGLAPATEVDYHGRVVAWEPPTNALASVFISANYDPVPLLPPAGGFASLLAPALYWGAQIAGTTWQQHGTQYLLSSSAIVLGRVPPSLAQVIVHADVAAIARQSVYVRLHYMGSTYLPWSQAYWLASQGDPWLGVFAPFVQQFTTTFLQNPASLGPAVSNAQINQSSFASAAPVTPATRPYTTLVSASVYVVPLVEEPTFFPDLEEGYMSIFKGTVDYNSPGWGGWSESLYSDVVTESYISMQRKMTNWLGYRMKLSVGPDNVGCTNPVVPYAIRVEDELVLRDTVLQYAQPPGAAPVAGSFVIPPGYTVAATGAYSQAVNQNLDMQLGARVKFTSGGGQQVATPMFHGMPVSAMSSVGTTYASAFLRTGSPGGPWLQNLALMTAYMARNGLGYRNISGAWNGANNTNGPSTAPAAWYYNTTLEMVELQWQATQFPGVITPIPTPVPGGIVAPYYLPPVANQASATWPAINAKARMQIRGWKNFTILNGRYTGQIVQPLVGLVAPNPYTPAPTTPYSFAIRILRKVRQPTDGSVPFVSPIAWTVWWPGEFTQPGQVLTPTSYFPGGVYGSQSDWMAALGQYQFIESKKLGKLWGAERGRARNRPT